MKNSVLFISSLFILGILNFNIYQKQMILKNGEIVLLQLVPVDPRSLMQGNYMSLAYAIEGQMNEKKTIPPTRNGFAVIAINDKNIGMFVRLYDGKNLEPHEKLIKYHYSPHQFRHFNIVPNSFLFQETHASYYERAKYALFKYRGKQDYLLAGLADEQGNMIKP